MSGFTTPRAVGQPKQMSSRLLTMKFMQRASASNSQSSPISPANQSPLGGSPYSAQDVPSAKRQKLETSTPSSSQPGTPLSAQSEPQYADRTAIFAALQAEQDARAAQRARNVMREGGETEWVLNLNLPATQGVNGYANHADTAANEEADEIWTSRTTGRQTYGEFKRKKILPMTNGSISSPVTAQFASNDADLSPAPSSESEASEDEEGEIHSSPAPGRQKYSSGQSTPTYSSTTSRPQQPSIKKRTSMLSDDHNVAAARRMDSLNMSRMSSLSGSHGPPRFKHGGNAQDKKKSFDKKKKKWKK